METKKPYKILLIDDDPLFGKVLAMKAKQKGVELVHQESLVDALYAYRLREFAAVIVDYMLVDMDGLEISHYMATFMEPLPIILISHSPVAWHKFQQDRHGAAAFVFKTDGFDHILDTALNLIPDSSLYAAATAPYKEIG